MQNHRNANDGYISYVFSQVLTFLIYIGEENNYKKIVFKTNVFLVCKRNHFLMVPPSTGYR